MTNAQMRHVLRYAMSELDLAIAQALSDGEHGFVEVDPCSGTLYAQVYLDSYFSLDPCGSFHHVLSPNGADQERDERGRFRPNCSAFWERLESVANRLGGFIAGGEGDPTDIYLGRRLTDEEIRKYNQAKRQSEFDDEPFGDVEIGENSNE